MEQLTKPTVRLYDDEGHPNQITQRVKQCLMMNKEMEKAREFEEKTKKIRFPLDNTTTEWKEKYDELLNTIFDYVEIEVVKRKN